MCFTKRKKRMIKKYKIHPKPKPKPNPKPTNETNHDNLFKPPIFINQNS